MKKSLSLGVFLYLFVLIYSLSPHHVVARRLSPISGIFHRFTGGMQWGFFSSVRVLNYDYLSLENLPLKLNAKAQRMLDVDFYNLRFRFEGGDDKLQSDFACNYFMHNGFIRIKLSDQSLEAINHLRNYNAQMFNEYLSRANLKKRTVDYDCNKKEFINS